MLTRAGNEFSRRLKCHNHRDPLVKPNFTTTNGLFEGPYTALAADLAGVSAAGVRVDPGEGDGAAARAVLPRPRQHHAGGGEALVGGPGPGGQPGGMFLLELDTSEV